MRVVNLVILYMCFKFDSIQLSNNNISFHMLTLPSDNNSEVFLQQLRLYASNITTHLKTSKPMQPNTSYQFPLSSQSFSFTNSPNPFTTHLHPTTHPPPPSPLQQKRLSFAHLIRQQHRQTHRRSLRSLHFKFLSQLGIPHPPHTDSPQSIESLIQQEETSTVTMFFDCEMDEKDRVFERLRDSYQAIDGYRWREFEFGEEVHSVDVWQRLREKIGETLGWKGEGKIQWGKEKIQWEKMGEGEWRELEKEVEFVAHLMSKQIFYPISEWQALQIIKPSSFGMLQSWLHQIYTIITSASPHNSHFILSLISLLTNLFIHYQLKIESSTIHNGTHNTLFYSQNQIRLWRDRELFDKLMTMPINFGKWVMVGRSRVKEVVVGVLQRVKGLVGERVGALRGERERQGNGGNEQGRKSDEVLREIGELVSSYSMILKETVISPTFLSTFTHTPTSTTISTSSTTPLLFLTILPLTQHLLHSVSSILPFFSQTLTSLLSIQHSLDHLFTHLHLNPTLDQPSSACFQLDEQFQEQYERLVEERGVGLERGHFLGEQGEMKREKEKNWKQQKGDCDWEVLVYGVRKVGLFSRMLGCVSQQMDGQHCQHQHKHQHKNQHHQQEYHQQEQQQQQPQHHHTQTRSTSHLIFTLHKFFSPSPSENHLNHLILSQIQTIDSIMDLQQILHSNTAKSHYNNHDNHNDDEKEIKFLQTKLTYEVLMAVEELFQLFNDRCQAFRKVYQELQTHGCSNSQQTLRQSASLVSQLYRLTMTLNQIAFSPLTSPIFKHSYLLYLLSSSSSTSSLTLIDRIAFLFSNLTKKTCGSIKEVQIKEELGRLMENVVYYVFPLQSHFEEFDPRDKDGSGKVVGRLVGVMKEGRVKKNQEEKLYNQKENNKLYNQNSKPNNHNPTPPLLLDPSHLFTLPYLTTHTSILLQLCSSFLTQPTIQLLLSGIKIPTLLLLLSPNEQVFEYFSSYIQGSTMVYKQIVELGEVHEHGRVVEAVEGFGEVLGDGFQGEGEDEETDKWERDVEI